MGGFAFSTKILIWRMTRPSRSDMSEVADSKKYAAELIGTFVLVFIGCGSATLAGKYIGFVGIAFAFGHLSVLVMVYAIGGISGCHINSIIP